MKIWLRARALPVADEARAHLAAISPLSSIGGLMLSAYSSLGVTEKESNKMFGQLFALSAGAVLFGGLLALTGLYSLF